MIKFVLLLLLVGQTTLTPVPEGRTAVDKCRDNHDKLYLSSGATKEVVSQKYFKLLGIMTWELSQVGYTGINDFTSDSELKNIKDLGFKDKEDFEKSKTISDTIDYINLWH